MAFKSIIVSSLRKSESILLICSRTLSTMSSPRQGLVIGFHQEGDSVALTKAADGFKSNKASNLLDLIKVSGLSEKKGKSRVFYGLDETFGSVAVVSLGKKDAGYNDAEEIEEGRENVRAGVAAGVKALHDAGVKVISVDPSGDPEAAAEAANLCVFNFDDLKTEKKPAPELKLYSESADDAASVEKAWERGTILAQAQNLSRRLMESPANIMTPTEFARIATEKVGSLNNVTVTVREQEWAESKKMGGFLGVSKGSDEPLKFVEVSYKGGKDGDAPLAIVGKGITFDSGGISIKPGAAMDEMRADMGGAACTLGSIYAAARLQLPINVMGFMPLCENMPSGKANKPGDVCFAMNGKSIQIDNTDAEGRLILSDALCYAEEFKPRGILDMATLTGAMGVALGSAAVGAFTNSTKFWEVMHKAGTRTGDRVWRMPIFKHYLTKVQKASVLADLDNTAGRAGGSCNAAVFLKEFVTNSNWMHLDIAGVMKHGSEVPYLTPGMSGRPTRTIVEFMNTLDK